MNEEISFDAFVQNIRASRAGDRSGKFQVSAIHIGGGVAGSISFDAPIAQVQDFYVGQKIKVVIYIK